MQGQGSLRDVYPEDRREPHGFTLYIGPCHFCDDDVVARFAGQYGPREVWARRHRLTVTASHQPRTSDEVWAEEVWAEEGEQDA
jgi:hypothetical protein